MKKKILLSALLASFTTAGFATNSLEQDVLDRTQPSGYSRVIKELKGDVTLASLTTLDALTTLGKALSGDVTAYNAYRTAINALPANSIGTAAAGFTGADYLAGIPQYQAVNGGAALVAGNALLAPYVIPAIVAGSDQDSLAYITKMLKNITFDRFYFGRAATGNLLATDIAAGGASVANGRDNISVETSRARLQAALGLGVAFAAYGAADVNYATARNNATLVQLALLAMTINTKL